MRSKYERDCNTMDRLTRRIQFGQIRRSSYCGFVAVGVALLASFSSQQLAYSLPFNQDMVGTQLSNGNIMRPKAAESVPVGTAKRFVGPNREDALRLTNPVPATEESVSNGSRLFAVNCSPCHGRYIEGKHVPGAVSTYLPGAELSAPFYKEKPDAHFFQFIHYGGMAIMPAYGWKLSIEEHWDIVNYIRHLQNTVGKEKLSE
jgi:mono/diheme cytochrome c family protein